MASSDTVSSPPALPSGLSAEQLLELYYYMRLTRSLEERLVALHRQSKVVGSLFRSLGQEACAVGSAYALDRTRGDMLSPLIRNLGSMLVQGATPAEVLRQYMAKADGPTRGRDLNIHYGTPERGFIGQISHLGDMVPVLAGIALSFKMRQQDAVALVYVGDGAMSTGTFHEGINFAAVQRLPLVVIAENNGYAFSTPTRRQSAVKHLADKAAAYGIPCVRADGNDVLAVYDVSRDSLDHARAGQGVTLVELETYRRKGHAEHDDQSYVPAGELAEWEARDPIDRYTHRLIETGWSSAEALAGVDQRVAEELDAAVAEVEPEPMPDTAAVLDDVLSTPAASPREWYRRQDA
jgi:pyruvate dehydrogenase E1 component alpha subunit/2-oxoisovalerate dehydrogenase E1 component alpha subunit